MGKAWDNETAKRVFLRMRGEGSSAESIIGMLKEIFPDTTEDDIVIFVADCLVKKPEKQRKEKRQEYIPSEKSSGGCEGADSHLGHHNC
jgi:hypothetical protein